MKVFLTSLVTSLLLFGCSSEPQERPMADDPTHVYEAIDPVSGGEVRTDSPWWTSHNGVRYYFESEGNLRKFEASPTSYVGSDGRGRRERRTLYPHDLQ